MPEVPATGVMTLEEREVLAKGIELYKDPPADFVNSRLTLTPMTPKYDQRVVRLAIEFPNFTGCGTGFMIGPDAVATAAHNLNHPTYGEAQSITCFIGGKGNTYVAKVSVSNTANFLRPSKWDSTKGYIYDYGVIKLGKDITNIGYFGFGAYSDSVLSNTFTLIGYGETQSQSGASAKLTNIGTYDFYYPIATRAGDSGAPIFYNTGSVAGIHAYGKNGETPPSATRITKTVFDDLKAWKYK